jgi:hypothetical protein
VPLACDARIPGPATCGLATTTTAAGIDRGAFERMLECLGKRTEASFRLRIATSIIHLSIVICNSMAMLYVAKHSGFGHK